MPPQKDSFTLLLVRSPWWVSVILAGIVYCILRFVFPLLGGDSMTFSLIGSVGPKVAPVLALLFLFIGGVSALRSFRVKTTLAKQDSLDSLKKLGWKEFEDIVGEYFRQRGYKVEEQLSAGGDGGVDLRLLKNGEKTLVQCKRWRSKKVGVPIVRELLGAMTAENSKNGILVTTSAYTHEAQMFAENHSIKLMDGDSLIHAIEKIHSNAVSPRSDLPPAEVEIVVPSCPFCGGEMMERIAKRGVNAGIQFWGCKAFPKCRGTMPIGG